jgi:uncharacterized protein (TIGR02391 family)
MAANPALAQIADAVCRRFVNMNKAAPRHELVVAYKNPMLLFEMEQHCILRARDNQQSFLPAAGAFALIEGELHDRAGFGTTVVLHALKNLFEVNLPTTDYGLAELCEHVAKMYPGGVPHDDVKLGLYLAQDFGVLGQYKPSDDGTQIESFRIAESVVTVTDPEQLWKDRIRNARGVGTAEAVTLAAEAFSILPPDMDEIWSLLHPAVSAIAEPRFAAGHYADAVEASLKYISEQVRAKSGLDDDGSSLMNMAFSPNAPKLVLGDVQTLTGRSMQQGYMQIFAGAMTGIRNPKAHGNVGIDAIRCIHFLFLASLLACKLDEAAVVVAPATTA